MKFLVLFIFIFSQIGFSNTQNEQVFAQQTIFPSSLTGLEFETLKVQVPQNLLSKAIQDILKNERVDFATVSYDAQSESDRQTAQNILLENKIPTRSVSEETLNAISKENVVVSLKEQNTLRTLLIIRCIGLGTGLYVGTGSSLEIAAFAGLFNYLLMELLYIPQKNGKMPGVEFVNSMIQKVKSQGLSQDPQMSNKRVQGIEATTNFLVNFSMNLAMLVPFVGMTGADFGQYIAEYLNPDLYYRSTYLAVITTLFMTSWKMAVSRWNMLAEQKGVTVMPRKYQSRMINGIDFGYSFINPGFWAGDPLSQMIVGGMGLSGFIAYFYYDIKTGLQSRQCTRYFNK